MHGSGDLDNPDYFYDGSRESHPGVTQLEYSIDIW